MEFKKIKSLFDIIDGTCVILVLLKLNKMLIINYTKPDCDTFNSLLYKFNNELIVTKVKLSIQIVNILNCQFIISKN